ncbi:MAG: heme ABC transporter ATP-binding protein [Bacteroidia bacterium]|nr:heme ABC transporter ATP-binding protein [Bacteroidia bacterium]
MLAAQHITYAINGKKLLDDVTVTFLPGKLNLIIGPNGAGKSTLIRVLSDQIRPQSGTVHFGDRNVRDISRQELARMRSVLSQSIELAFPLKVSEVVMMGRYPHFTSRPRPLDEAICWEAIDFFDLTGLVDRNYLTLSGGERQRVNFARVLAQIWDAQPGSCRYLVLDEPLTFLDVHYQFHFMQKLIELLKGQDLVVLGVVHDLNLAARFSDQTILIYQGKVLADGHPQEVLTRENILTAYHLEPVFYTEEDATYLFFK